MVKIVLSVIYCIVCVALAVIVLMQEGKDAGLGALGGSQSGTYWDKNRGRSAEGTMKKLTTLLVVCFFALSILLM